MIGFKCVQIKADWCKFPHRTQTKNAVLPSGERRNSCKKLLAAKAAVEAVHTSAGINQLLLARVERMALGANFHVDLGLGGAGLDHVAACAGDGAVNVVGMDTLFHSIHLISGSDK